MVARIATYSHNQIVMNENMRLQSQYANLQFQVSSGLKSDNYKGIGSDTQSLLNIEGDLARLKAYTDDANSVKSRVDIMYNATQSMIDISQKMLASLTASLGGNFVTPAVVQSDAQNAMNETAALLNISSGGRHLFGGSAIDNPPVDLTDPLWVAQTPPSVANSTYYQGAPDTLSVQISDSLTIDYGIRADNPAFEQMLRAFNLTFNNPNNTTALSEAHTLLKAAIEGMATVQGMISADASTLEKQVVRNEQDLAVMKGIISNYKEVDVAQKSIEFNQIGIQLEASYSATTRLLQLNLHDFL